jgi:hypothetical protein
LADDRYDRVLVFNPGDLPDRALRLDLEVLHGARQGLRMGLRPLPDAGGPPRVPTYVREHVSEGRAAIIEAGRKVTAESVVVHNWSDGDGILATLADLTTDKVDVLLYGSRGSLPDLDALAFSGKSVRVLDVMGSGLPGEGSVTASYAGLFSPGQPYLDALPRPALAGVAWLTPPLAEAMKRAPDLLAEARIDLLDLSATPYRRFTLASGGFMDLGYGDLAIERLTRRLDTILCYPPDGELAPYDALIRSALSAGVQVVLPPWMEPHYAAGPCYCPPSHIVERLGHPPFVTRTSAGPPMSTGVGLGGAPPRQASATRFGRAPGRRRRPKRKSVIFLPAKGGLGHLVRCLAIARRLGPGIPVVVASQVPALRAIEDLGFQAEFLPTAPGLGPAPPEWDDWLRDDLDRLIETHNAGAVIYDGNHLAPSLVQAVGPRHGCRLGWVRRGMWGRTTSRFLGNARWCDAILEPGEIAGARDTGITANRRSETIPTSPVRLLDPPDLLSRDDARAALGLDAARDAALIQLGSGLHRDLAALLDRIIGILRRFPDLQVCIAEYKPSGGAARRWPHVTYVNQFPLALYYKAFDFSIAAAGYNTFVDVISFGLPTIFLPNQHPSMDDQSGRAKFAQDHAAGFELAERDLPELEDVVTLILNERARAFLRNNCLRLASGNGAPAAAQVVERLLHAEVA